MGWLSPELRTASVIPRWVVVWTLARDTVANHSYFVAMYANQIADLLHWSGPRGDLLLYALLHDIDETITGDLVAPAKREILDTIRAQTYIERKMAERLPREQKELDRIRNSRWGSDIERIVKAADRIDAVIFLVIEARLGNSVIQPRIPEVKKNLQDAWQNLPLEWRDLAATTEMLDRIYRETVLPAIDQHAVTGGYGI